MVTQDDVNAYNSFKTKKNTKRKTSERKSKKKQQGELLSAN